MKTKNIILGIFATLLLGHLFADFYFLINYVYPLEDKTKGWYMNNNSYIVDSWLGSGKRLVNEKGRRSKTYQDILFNDSWANEDSMVRIFENGKVGFINSNTMKICILPKYHYLSEFSEGYALAIKSDSSDHFGFIDRKGSWKIPSKFDSRYLFEDDDTTYYRPHFWKNFCYIKIENSKYVIINKDGVIVSKRPYDQIRLLGNGYRQVVIDKKFGIIDSCFHEVIPPLLYTQKELRKIMKFNNILIY